jgi:hypothetical protein
VEPLWLSGKVMEYENKLNQKIPGSLPKEEEGELPLVELPPSLNAEVIQVLPGEDGPGVDFMNQFRP